MLTEKHQHETMKLVVEGGWVQKRLYDIGLSNEKKCGGCNKEQGTEKHLSVLEEGQKPDPRKAGEMGAEGQDIKERLEVAKRNHVVHFG